VSQVFISRLERADLVSINLRYLRSLLEYVRSHGVSADQFLFGRDPLAAASDEKLMTEVGARVMASWFSELGESMPDHDGSRALQAEHLRGRPDISKIGQTLLVAMKDYYVRSQSKDSASPAEPVNLPPGLGVPEPTYQVTRTFERGFRVVSREEIGEYWEYGLHIPIIGRLAAGEGVDTAEAESHPPGWADAYLIYEESSPPDAFALRVTGDSMQPVFSDGDMVIIDPDHQVTEGVCCVIYQADGQRLARLKVLHCTKRTVTLSSTTPLYPSVKIPPKSLIAAYAIFKHLPQIVELPAPGD